MGSFSLPDLPYEYDDLEPTIDRMTMEIHHSKHHNAYVTKLNVAVEEQTLKENLWKNYYPMFQIILPPYEITGADISTIRYSGQ